MRSGPYISADGKIPVTRAVFRANYDAAARVEDTVIVGKLIASVGGPAAGEALRALCRVVGISENIMRNAIREVQHADD